MSWDSFARRLSARFHCVAYDQRGHGQSDDATDYSYEALTGDIDAIIAALRLHAPLIVGHSWGGQIATIYAAGHANCAGIIAVDGILTGEEEPQISEEDWAEMEVQLRANPVVSRLADFAGTPADVERFLMDLRPLVPSAYPEFSEAAFRRDLIADDAGRLHSHHSMAQFVALNRAVAEHPLPGPEVYGRIRCPVLLVMANRGLFHRNEVEQILKINPRIRIEWVDAGHSVQADRPTELERLIVRFTTSYVD